MQGRLTCILHQIWWWGMMYEMMYDNFVMSAGCIKTNGAVKLLLTPFVFPKKWSVAFVAKLWLSFYLVSKCHEKMYMYTKKFCKLWSLSIGTPTVYCTSAVYYTTMYWSLSSISELLTPRVILRYTLEVY